MKGIASAVLWAAVVTATSPAMANGRFPASRDVVVDGDRLLVPTTFGLLISTDGGADVRWVCEEALGYSGTYDPSYTIGADGSIWLTTFDGVRVSRDGGCVWTAVGAPFDELFAAQLAADSSGRVWAVTAEAGKSNGVYRNDDPANDTFARLDLDVGDALLTSIVVGSGGRVYVSGFVIPSGELPQPVLYRSDNDGVSWNPLPTGDIDLGNQPRFKVRAVDPNDPDRIVLTQAKGTGDVVYRSLDGGMNVEEVLTTSAEVMVVLIRDNGDVLVGAGAEGEYLSTDGGATFTRPASGPQLVCAAENGAAVLGCGTTAPPDHFALGSSTDGVTWSPVLRFEDIDGPLECPMGTIQHDICDLMLWPGLVQQLGLDGDDDDDGGPTKNKKSGCGCHAAGGAGAASLALLMLAAALVGGRWRRRH